MGGAGSVGEACSEGSCAGSAGVGNGVSELPGIFARFGAAGEAGAWTCAPQRGMHVVLGASTRQCGKCWVVSDDPSTLSVALVGGIDGTASVFTQVHRDDERIPSTQDALPAREVERGRVSARGGRVFSNDDVPCVRHCAVQGSGKGSELCAVLFPLGAIRMTHGVLEGPGAAVVDLPITERAAWELDKPVRRSGSGW